jgi:hypothetical protein
MSTVAVPALGGRVLAVCLAGQSDLDYVPALLAAFRTSPASDHIVVALHATSACSRHYALAYGATVAIIGDPTGELEAAYASEFSGRPFSVVVDHLAAIVARVAEPDPARHVQALTEALTNVRTSTSWCRGVVASVASSCSSSADDCASPRPLARNAWAR